MLESDQDPAWAENVRFTRFAVVVGAFIALSVSPLAIITQSTGMFVMPMTREFGWTRTVFFLGPSIASVAGGLLLPVIGSWGDRVGVRPVLLGGVVIYGSGLICMAFLQNSIPAYIAVSVLTVIGGVTQSSLLFARAISAWFASRRGLMLSIAISGIGVGSTLTPLLTHSLIERFGWRVAYVGLGALVELLALPAILLLVREPPRGVAPDCDSAQRVVITNGLSLREAARTRTYWLLITLFAAGNGAFFSLVNNLFLILTSRGIAAAASALSALGASQILTRLLSGYVLDKAPRAAFASVWYVLATGGMVLLCFAHTSSAAIAAGLLIGTAWGAENELAAYFTARYFGLRSYGLILGTFFAVFALGGMPAVVLSARLFDRYGNYDFVLILMVACLAVSSLVAACLGPYRFSKSGALLSPL